MKFKNTFYNWLTNRFILIIRNEENFAVHRTFSFNYAKLIVLSIFAFIVVFTIAFYTITTVLSRWYNPEHFQLETARKIILLSSKVDSLAFELDRKDKYINHFKKLITGEVSKFEKEVGKNVNPSVDISVQPEKISSEDSLLRKKFENELAEIGLDLKRRPVLQGRQFFNPVEGLIQKRFNLEKEYKGIQIASQKEEPVKFLTSGQVIHADATFPLRTVVTQDEVNNLIVKYKFVGEISVKEGEKVEGGQLLGLLTEQDPKLYLEVWVDGTCIDPSYFVSY